MHFAARLHVVLVLVMALGLVLTPQVVALTNTQSATSTSAVANVTTQIVATTDTQPTTPSGTVAATAKHNKPLYNKASVILLAGFFVLLNLITVTGLYFLWLEGRDQTGAVEETRATREVVEELELTDRLTWGRS